MTLDKMIAREAIRDTIAAYTMNGDRGAIAAYAATFAADGVLETSLGSATGPEAIVAFVHDVAIPDMAEYLALESRVRHHLGTQQIVLHGSDDAEAWTYFQLVAAGQILEHGVYHDRLRAEDGRWLFVRRRIKIEWERRRRGQGEN